jgi:DNA-nicking Smr family endonuclease
MKSRQHAACEGHKGRGARDGPPSEDHDLWQLTAASIEPLRRRKPRVPGTPPPDCGGPQPHGSEGPTKSAEPQDRRKPPSSPAPDAHPLRRAPEREAPPLAAFERRKARRIAAGYQDIDARLDLHGLTQRDAHPRLRAFLLDCAGRGLATVLVITGKGGPPEAGNDRLDASLDRPNRGVLKRMVPRWLAEPDLRAVVVSFTAAAIRHGGDGALYVQLRRRSAGPTGA